MKIVKKGGKTIGKEKYGVTFVLSTGGEITFPFPIVPQLRNKFIHRIYELRKKIFHLNEDVWKPDPSWVLNLSNISNDKIIKNDFCDIYPPYILLPEF